MIADTHRMLVGDLRQALRAAGFTPISTVTGIQWAEPDSVISEAVRKLIAEMKER